ncbi:MAG TPA: phytoene/squalene synthase family protein, partial [Anaerolineales bacterium]|nr:phytoene/squalene synthase family protein [Anaerolineales bacterium]
DDIVDDSRQASAQAHLEQWRAFSFGWGTSPRAGVGEAWADTLVRFQIPRRYASQLIDGVGRDLSGTGYEQFDDLATYCYGVASTVGLMSMYVIGFESAAAVPYAIKLGVALQLTNILRDVGEDLRRGRLYLPRLELREFGVSERDLASGRVTPSWRSFMRFQIDRARRLYREAAPGIHMLNADGRLAIAAAADLYAGILREIERNDYDVFSHRASVTTFRKVVRVVPLFIRSMRLR